MIRENDNVFDSSIEDLEKEKEEINKNFRKTFNPLKKLKLAKKELKINEQIAKLTIERIN